VVGFGTIATMNFRWAVSDISREDGKCRVGIRRYATLPLLTFDILINILLTLIFVYHLIPVIRSNRLMDLSKPISHFATCLGYCRASTKGEGIRFHTGNAKVAKRIEHLIWRSLIGSCLVLIPTAANMTQLTILKGHELGFLCIIICNSDSRSSRHGHFIMLIS
jgi:hypothetical protein